MKFISKRSSASDVGSVTCQRPPPSRRTANQPNPVAYRALSSVATADLWFLDQAVMDCIKRQFETVGDAEFVEDVVKMVFDGLFADEKLLADFFVAEALGDELDDFLLTVADERLSAARVGVGCRESVGPLGGHANIQGPRNLAESW